MALRWGIGFALLLSPLCWARTYSTNFPLTESPICEGGNWQNGKTNGVGACSGIIGGIDWNDMATAGGFAFNVGGSGFADGTAVLRGSWGTNQYVRGVAKCNPADTNPEIELRLRTTISAHVINGYEFDLACTSGAGQFIAIVRWNGPVGNFTQLNAGNSFGVSTGDLVEATAVGCALTVYVNGISKVAVSDCTYSGGSPGIGSEQTTGAGSDQAWTSFYASDSIPWLGVLSPTRAIDWSKAGLPATFPNGETTTNPWTPPSGRTQCVTAACNTVTSNAGSSTPAQINAAIASAATRSFVLLPAGTYTIGSDITFLGSNYVTLRGSGAQSTILNLSGTARVQFGQSTLNGSAKLSATSYTPNTSTVTMTAATCGASCSGLAANTVANIRQCDTGWTGSGALGGDPFSPSCTSGAYVDNGEVFVCGIDYGVCANNNINTDANHYYQRQTVTITNVVNNGGGSYTVTFTPGLYQKNWSSNRNAQMYWGTPTGNWTYGVGLEDATVNFTTTTAKIDVEEAYGWWVKGTRILGGPADQISIATSVHGLFSNNYVFGLTYNSVATANSEPLLRSQESDNLLLNNMFQTGQCLWANGQSAGTVMAYNYCVDGATAYYQSVELDHNPWEVFRLLEGNQMGYSQDDDTHGTHGINTWFRNYFSANDRAYYTQNSQAFSLGNYHRFDNFIGNALGSTQSTSYSGSTFGNEYVILTTDPLASASFTRWGNCDVINASCRFLTAEVADATRMPAGTYPNAVAYQNFDPANNNLPCSFFMTGTAAVSPCTVLNGGTGLSWWKVCNSWSSFPTCSTTQTPPFPPVGPDQSGGAYVNGHAFDIPAAVAFFNLPNDTAFQNSLTITASTWSNVAATCNKAGAQNTTGLAPCEILTVTLSGIDNGSSNHIIGGFRIPGLPASCKPGSGISFTGRSDGEILMTSSSTTQIAYSLASDPGANVCTGTMLWPDVRQFDEGIYQADGGSSGPPVNAPASVMFMTSNETSEPVRGHLQ